MNIPEKVNLTCQHCKHVWLEPTVNLLSQETVVYRGETSNTVKRRATCPNCNLGVIAKVPREWVDEYGK